MKAKRLFVLCAGLLVVAGFLVHQRIARASILGAGFDSELSGSVVLDSWAYANGVEDHDAGGGDLSTSGGAFTDATVTDERNVTTRQRSALMLGLTRDAIFHAKRAIARAHPNLDSRERDLLYLEMTHGQELQVEVGRYLENRPT